MMEYKRLTNNNLDEYNPEHDFCVGCEHFGEPNGCNRWNGTCGNYERFMETYNRLAELEDKIEQGKLKEEKTCKNISEMHPVDGFTCSECGISLVDYCEKEVDEENGDITYREYMLRYCPNCGAKVVEDLQQ